MIEYISREDAVTVADYAVDEHKTPGKPETFSEYNQGWQDACDYIRATIEALAPADVAPVRHGRWEAKEKCRGGFKRRTGCDEWGNTHTITVDERFSTIALYCSECGKLNDGSAVDYCPNCGAKMDGGDENV